MCEQDNAGGSEDAVDPSHCCAGPRAEEIELEVGKDKQLFGNDRIMEVPTQVGIKLVRIA